MGLEKSRFIKIRLIQETHLTIEGDGAAGAETLAALSEPQVTFRG